MKKTLFSLLACITCFPYTAVVASQTGPAIGSIAPDFKARNLVTGEVSLLSSQRGKIVILTFWASWCAPCRRELPNLEKAQLVVGKDRLTVFAVSFKESPDAERQLKRLASTWHINVIQDSSGWIAGHYDITSVPHLFLIDREGKVVANHVGYGDRSLEELVADINHALTGSKLAEQDSPPPPADSTP
jgi:thiol-disulfide isomerase/thioredoxin